MTNLFKNYHRLCELRIMPTERDSLFKEYLYNVPNLLSITGDKRLYEYFLQVEGDEECKVACAGLINLLTFGPGFLRLYATHLHCIEGKLDLAVRYHQSADHLEGMATLLHPVIIELKQLREAIQEMKVH